MCKSPDVLLQDELLCLSFVADLMWCKPHVMCAQLELQVLKVGWFSGLEGLKIGVFHWQGESPLQAESSVSDHYRDTLWCVHEVSKWFLSTNLASHRRHRGHVAVHSCPVRGETVETVEETCDWALTVTSRSLWTMSAQRWCRLFPLHWQLGRSKVDREVLRTWRPMSPTDTRNVLV